MLEIINISKVYKNRVETVYALKDCSLIIKENQFIIISGKSGSGKTTLINLISSLDKPSSGDILYNGQSIFKNSEEYRNQVVGVIFQEHNLLDHLTVKENIRLSLELQGRNVSDEEIIAILKKVALEEYIDKYPNQLSTGQHQRCAIARALIKSPKIIIADEPTGSLDEDTGDQIMTLLKELSKEYLVIIVTHNIEYPKKYADRHIVINYGKIIKDEVINTNCNPIRDSVNLEKSHNKLTLFSKGNYVKSYIKANINHMLRSILMLTLTMLLMFFFYTLLNINKSKMIYKTITSDKSNIGYYLNNMLYIKEDNCVTESNLGFYTQDIEKMKEDYNNQNIYPIIRNQIPLDENDQIDLIFNGYSSGLMEIDDKILSNLNFSLVDGNLPKEYSDSQVDIAITKFLYNYLKEYSTDDEKIINKIIEYQGIKYKITGIIDTNYNFSYFGDYLLKNETKIDQNKKDQYHNLITTEVHTMIFVPVNYFKFIIDDKIRVKLEGIKERNVIEWLSQITYVSKYTNNNNILFRTDSITLNENDVIIDISLLYKDRIDININDLINEFAKNHFEEIKSDFEKDYPNSTYLNYANYIRSNKFNKYHPDKTYKSFETTVLLNEIDDLNRKELKLKVSSNKGDFAENINIVGISFNNESGIIISDSFFNKVKNIAHGTYESVLVKVSDKYRYDKPIISNYMNKNSNESIDNSILNTLYQFLSTYKSLQIFIIILFSLFTVITVILILYFINDTLKNAKNDIGLLLALGAKIKDAKQIYYIAVSFNMITSILFSLILYFILSPFVNLFFRYEYVLYTNVLFFDFKLVFNYIISLILIYTLIYYILANIILRTKSIKSLYVQKN